MSSKIGRPIYHFKKKRKNRKLLKIRLGKCHQKLANKKMIESSRYLLKTILQSIGNENTSIGSGVYKNNQFKLRKISR